MLKAILGLGAVYLVAYVVSTPESRAAAKGPVNDFGKALLAVTWGSFGLIWLASTI